MIVFTFSIDGTLIRKTIAMGKDWVKSNVEIKCILSVHEALVLLIRVRDKLWDLIIKIVLICAKLFFSLDYNKKC